MVAYESKNKQEFAFCCCDKYQEQKQVGEEMIYLAFMSPIIVHHWEHSEITQSSVEAGTIWERLTGWLPVACSSCFLFYDLGWWHHPHGLSFPTSIINQKMSYRLTHSTIWCKQLRLCLFQDITSQIDVTIEDLLPLSGCSVDWIRNKDTSPLLQNDKI